MIDSATPVNPQRTKSRLAREKLSPSNLLQAPSRTSSLQSITSNYLFKDSHDISSSAPNVRRPSQARLVELRQRISGFEQQIEDDTRQRRENEEGRLNSIRDSILNLEKTLNAEVKRRVDANKALQSMFEAQITTVYDKMEATFAEKLDQLGTASEKLSDRLALVEQDLHETGMLTTVEEKCSSVSREVAALQGLVDAESLGRQTSEEATSKQLAGIESTVDSTIESERAQRERNFSTIREELEEIRESRVDEEEKFQNFTLEEIAGLKSNLSDESKTREQADDDIVQALHYYTEVLQEALRSVTS